jgi:hypothetical protein
VGKYSSDASCRGDRNILLHTSYAGVRPRSVQNVRYAAKRRNELLDELGECLRSEQKLSEPIRDLAGRRRRNRGCQTY